MNIPIENVLKEGRTTIEKFCDKNYIIYINPKEPRQKIRINTEYVIIGDVVQMCKSYDRGLCDTMEEYKRLKLRYIESEAYGSWMDGAR